MLRAGRVPLRRLSRAASLAVPILAVGLGRAWADGTAGGAPLPIGPAPAATDTAGPPAPLPVPALPTPPPLPWSLSIERQPLAAPSAESVGTLESAQGGLGGDLWSGASTAEVRALMARLPMGLASPAVRDLARRALLTAAAAPAGAEAGAGTDPPSLVETRIRTLLALGDPGGAADLAEAVPASLDTPGLARTRMDAQLLAGRTDRACNGLAAAGSDGDDSLTEMRVLCALSHGDGARAGLDLDMLHDRKPADAVFLAAADTLSGAPPARLDLGLPRDLSPVQVAALAQARLAPPPETIATLSPAALHALATLSAFPPAIRLQAALRAAPLGIVDTAALRAALTGLPLTPQDLAAAPARAAALPPPAALALLVRAAEATPNPADRVGLIGKALDLAGRNGWYAPVARLLADDIANLPAGPALAPFAAEAARALLVAGRFAPAQPWLAMAQGDPDQAKAVARLWPLLRLWGADQGAAAVPPDWRAHQDPAHALMALGLLSALGRVDPGAVLPGLLDVPGSAGPPPALVILLETARDRHARGLALLAALAMLAPGTPDPAAQSLAVGTLRAAGWDGEARHVAADLLLADGI